LRRLLVLALCALLTAGCAGSGDKAAQETVSQPATGEPPPETQTTPSDLDSTPPHSYREVLARLPPFDEPASPEVAAWRKATITAFLGRCLTGAGGADRASFVRANRKVLKELAVYRGATVVDEHSVARRDGNGCPENTGPATYYTTYRRYRLPAVTKPAAVFRHYESELFGWVEAAISSCDHTFGQGPAYLDVNACGRVLRVAVQAHGPVEPQGPAVLPPRPFGAQYPPASRYLATPKPTGYDVKPGESCERVSGAVVPSIIVPPPPGLSAKVRGRHVVVEWTLGTVHGDCPPSALALTVSAAPRATIAEPVHAASGVSRIRLSETAPLPKQVTGRTLSVDGAQSRAVAVLVRAP